MRGVLSEPRWPGDPLWPKAGAIGRAVYRWSTGRGWSKWHLFSGSVFEWTEHGGKRVASRVTRLEMECGLHVAPGQRSLAMANVSFELEEYDGGETVAGVLRGISGGPDEVCKGCLMLASAAVVKDRAASAL